MAVTPLYTENGLTLKRALKMQGFYVLDDVRAGVLWEIPGVRTFAISYFCIVLQ